MSFRINRVHFAGPVPDGHLRMTSVILWTGDLWFKLVPGTRSRERADVPFL